VQSAVDSLLKKVCTKPFVEVEGFASLLEVTEEETPALQARALLGLACCEGESNKVDLRTGLFCGNGANTGALRAVGNVLAAFPDLPPGSAVT
jgi:hypothetical protein